ncbi:MAG: TonB-linked outer membrane protein SusC/RagA family, partial [Bacteroidota bacterium]|nr:TonB-linked outer membrane protein SusC/RagA family [Bacteroidota bacterium]
MRKIFSVLFLCLSIYASAQKGSVKGFIYDKANGEPIPFATIKVEKTDLGAVTDEQGFFSIPNLPLGNYKLNFSYVGYTSQDQEVEIKKSQTVNLKIFLSSKTVELGGVEISAEQQKKVTETRVSVTSITPMEMRRIPSIGGEPDIAQYLQILPGVISTGDQGGQIVIRGGTPIQTSFLLDGMQIFNPFHSIGLFSVYETDIIKNVDVYTGGFPAQYGTRTSAVIDITTRDGNQKQFSGKI